MENTCIIFAIKRTLTPVKTPLKGLYGAIGYGCCKRHPQHRCDYSNYRKAFRQIRRYGFDASETWNLDRTISLWMVDHHPELKEWGNPDLLEDAVDAWYSQNRDIATENLWYYENIVYKQFVDDIFKCISEFTDSEWTEFEEFLCPRLKYFSNPHNLHGWPGEGRYDYIHSYEDYVQVLSEIYDSIKAHQIHPHFQELYGNLWD